MAATALARSAMPDTEQETGDTTALRRVVHDGVATQIMATLTGGPILVAFALALGGGPLLIGAIAAVSPLAQLAQVPGVWLVERIRDRRRIVLVAAGASRLFWLVPVVLALTVPTAATLFLLLAMTAHFILGGVAGTAWNSWMRDLVPERTLGSFFGRRMQVMTLVGIPLFLAAGWFVDQWPTVRPGRGLEAFAILFLVGLLAGLSGLLFLARTAEPPLAPAARAPLWQSLRRPLQDRVFRRLVHFLFAWSFAFSLSAPFFAVYMLSNLGLSLTTVLALTVLSQVVYLAFLGTWGRTADRYSNRTVLHICGPLYVLALAAWTFTTMPDPHRYTMPLLVVIHILMGIAMSGTVLATQNIGMKLAPRGAATSWLATASIATSVAAAAAPLLGGALVEFFAVRNLRVTLSWRSPAGAWDLPTVDLQEWDFFFAIAVLVGIYALHRLAAVEEHGHVEERVALGMLASDLRQEMRNLSSVPGIRSLIQFPITLLRIPRRKRTRRRRGEPEP